LNQQPKKPSNLVYQKSTEILTDVGFCAPDDRLLILLMKAGLPVDKDPSIVKISHGLLDSVINILPKVELINSNTPRRIFSKKAYKKNIIPAIGNQNSSTRKPMKPALRRRNH